MKRALLNAAAVVLCLTAVSTVNAQYRPPMPYTQQYMNYVEMTRQIQRDLRMGRYRDPLRLPPRTQVVWDVRRQRWVQIRIR